MLVSLPVCGLGQLTTAITSVLLWPPPRGCGCCRLLQALDDDCDQRHDEQRQDSVERVVDHSGYLRLQRTRLSGC